MDPYRTAPPIVVRKPHKHSLYMRMRRQYQRYLIWRDGKFATRRPHRFRFCRGCNSMIKSYGFVSVCKCCRDEGLSEGIDTFYGRIINEMDHQGAMLNTIGAHLDSLGGGPAKY